MDHIKINVSEFYNKFIKPHEDSMTDWVHQEMRIIFNLEDDRDISYSVEEVPVRMVDEYLDRISSRHIQSFRDEDTVFSIYEVSEFVILYTINNINDGLEVYKIDLS